MKPCINDKCLVLDSMTTRCMVRNTCRNYECAPWGDTLVMHASFNEMVAKQIQIERACIEAKWICGFDQC